MPATIYAETPAEGVYLAAYNADQNKWLLLNAGGSGGGGGGSGGSSPYLMARYPASGTCFWECNPLTFTHVEGSGCCWSPNAPAYLYPVGFTPAVSGYYEAEYIGTYNNKDVYSAVSPIVSLTRCSFELVDNDCPNTDCNQHPVRWRFDISSTLTGEGALCGSCEEAVGGEKVLQYTNEILSPECYWVYGWSLTELACDNEVPLVTYSWAIIPAGDFWRLELVGQNVPGGGIYHHRYRCPENEWMCLGPNTFTLYEEVFNPSGGEVPGKLCPNMPQTITVYPAE